MSNERSPRPSCCTTMGTSGMWGSSFAQPVGCVWPPTVSCNPMVARDVMLPVDREAAWDALTDPEALAQWLGEPSRLELEPGGAAAFTLRNGEERHAVVEEVTPGERL